MTDEEKPKYIREFHKSLTLEFDNDNDIHAVIYNDLGNYTSVEIANYFGGGGNKEIYLAALKLKEAIEKFGQEHKVT